MASVPLGSFACYSLALRVPGCVAPPRHKFDYASSATPCQERGWTARLACELTERATSQELRMFPVPESLRMLVHVDGSDVPACRRAVGRATRVDRHARQQQGRADGDLDPPGPGAANLLMRPPRESCRDCQNGEQHQPRDQASGETRTVTVAAPPG